MTLEEAAEHTYLLYGHGPRDGPPSMDPLTLHRSAPPVALPVRSKEGAGGGGGGGGGDGHDEHLWARRQFSVLWAPMPSDTNAAQYQVRCSETGYLALLLTMCASTLSHSPISATLSYLLLYSADRGWGSKGRALVLPLALQHGCHTGNGTGTPVPILPVATLTNLRSTPPPLLLFR